MIFTNLNAEERNFIRNLIIAHLRGEEVYPSPLTEDDKYRLAQKVGRGEAGEGLKNCAPG